MIIVLIHWRIRSEQKHIDKFLHNWKVELPVEDKSKLVGEFLSEPIPADDLEHMPPSSITWNLDQDDLGDHKSYVNIGIWESEKAFYDQIGHYFNKNDDMKDFERYPRDRIILRPLEHRRGEEQLPEGDSPGTK